MRRLVTGGGGARCEICHRPLSDPESVKRGIGPVCGGRFALVDARQEQAPEDEAETTAFTEEIVIRRSRQGAVITNVPRLVTQHSPSGYEFGYGGSGPADLALNVLENVLTAQGYRGERVKCFHGTCFDLAYRLHNSFKFEFIATLDQERGGTIAYQAVADWIGRKQSFLELEDEMRARFEAALDEAMSAEEAIEES